MDQIGKYEILEKIGTGGFAIVYKGYDPYIRRPVAIKVCYSRDGETRQRFQREAEIAGLLEHRNITTVYDAGVHEDQVPYLVEEYLSGEDLAHLIRRQEPEALESKLDYLIQIASGMGYAHSRGVIHRDIKPGNVRVLDNGRLKIMDFGTAKLAHVESNLTQTGMTLGTVAYLSPERLLGQPSGTNSDIFSYGVLAYELLTFRRPFSGRNIPNLIDQVLNAAPIPLSECWPECPPSLAKVVHKCLLKDPQERYGSCEEVLADLEAVQREVCPQMLVGQESSTMIPQISVQLSGLMERARQHYERGKYDRAELLIDEVLEIDPQSIDARQLLEATRAAKARQTDTAPIPPPPVGSPTDSGGLSTSQTNTWESPEARKGRKIQEAVHSIGSYIEADQLQKAADALRFATDFFGAFPESAQLRRRITNRLQQHLVELKGAALRQARKAVQDMDRLKRKNLLPLELAVIFRDWVHAFDPDDLAAGQILARVEHEARDQERARKSEISDGKKQEAVASIERLLEEGNPDMAEKALQFAVRLFGEFEQAKHLRQRIAEARGH